MSMANAEAVAHAPEAIGGTPAATRIREAFAMLQLAAGQSQGTATKTREIKPPHPVKIARRRAPPRVAMVRHPQFGWSGETFWW
jgi:hypothetical protein